MTSRSNLIAWIERRGSGRFVGAFVGEGAGPDPERNFPGRQPATQVFSSRDEASEWINQQAMALGLPVKWVGDTQDASSEESVFPL